MNHRGRPRKASYEAIAARRNEGATYAQLCAEFGVSDNTVQRALNPDYNERQAALKRAHTASLKKPCEGGCGRMVWTHYASASGLCFVCSGVARRTAPCGTETAYQRGCRCDECRSASSAARRRRRTAA